MYRVQSFPNKIYVMLITGTLTLSLTLQHMATKSPAKSNNSLPASQSLNSFELSLSQRGFLRAQKSYTPAADVEARLQGIVTSIFTSTQNWDTKITDPTLRFQLLKTCFKEFQHSIPNSMLYAIETIGDVLEFYTTPIDTRTPLEAMKTMDLPPNLHVLHEYHRFHPDTDTMFGGISAFPKSSTIVTGLRYKDKYPGHVAKKSWP
ncbi:UNVERIFIED_CONTAM: hypothetical protein B566_EDAN018664 [Ephemera danica]|nr:hypothetical protein B566_EDAN018664 [Ephemera danica]